MAEQADSVVATDLVRQILERRGFKSQAAVERFLHPSYEDDLGDPFLLTDMAKAVDRIIRAIESKEPIAIYGDYDIDGLTATSLLLDWLGQLGANVAPYIPDRFEEGYGLNQDALAKLQSDGIKLVVSVDCGVTSRGEAGWAKRHGLDLIITDHHAVPAELPDAIAVINPKRPGDKYPYMDLAGVGVAFKLAQALQQRLGRPPLGQEKWLLDLVALGTVCDVVPLTGENRVLVHYGLKVLAQTRRIGLRALADVAAVNLDAVRSYHLGFMLGPRLNAAGRLEHANKALSLLTTTERETAETAAHYLDQLNQDRRDQQDQILTQAITAAEAYQNDPVLILISPDWSHGIVGIVASKLMERFHKPVILLQDLGETAKGSGRSIGSFNLVENLRAMEELFIKMGGHHFAAGFTIPIERVDELRQRLNQRARTQGIVIEESPAADIELDDFGPVTLELIDQLDQLEPFGNANPKPILATSGAKVVRARGVGAQAQHLKLVLSDANGVTVGGIAFGQAEDHPNLLEGQDVEVWYQVAQNDFFETPQAELVVSRLR